MRATGVLPTPRMSHHADFLKSVLSTSYSWPKRNDCMYSYRMYVNTKYEIRIRILRTGCSYRYHRLQLSIDQSSGTPLQQYQRAMREYMSQRWSISSFYYH